MAEERWTHTSESAKQDKEAMRSCKIIVDGGERGRKANESGSGKQKLLTVSVKDNETPKPERR